MADNFGELNDEVTIDEDVLAQKIEYDKIFLNCYNTPEGKRMIDTLQDRVVDIAIYEKGSTLEATSYRQGRADLVKEILQSVGEALNPITTR